MRRRSLFLKSKWNLCKQIAVVLLLICTGLKGVYCEEEQDYFDFSSFKFELDIEAFSQSPDNKVLLAHAVKDYFVTPGDVYKLTYLSNEGSVSSEIIVTSDFSININLFGNINAGNLTYSQLRDKIESIILKAYPESKPQLVLQTTGIFQVYLKGEVKNTSFISCWGLTRLADILSKRTTSYSSIRDIEIQSINGKKTTYDIFSFIRSGDKAQNPYLRPDDTVVVKQVQRQIKLNGEIRRPGTYQLTDADSLNQVISFYGNGLTKLADPARIRITRCDTEKGIPGETLYIDSTASEYTDFSIHDLDQIYIPSKREQLPFVYFEGAVEASNKSNIHLYIFTQGERLSTAARNMSRLFNASSDLVHSYIIRKGETAPLAVNIEALIRSYTAENDLLLMPEDRIVIPFKQYFVFTGGAVITPGNYPYIPDKDYLYYINLAGGIDPAKNSNQKVIITDKDKISYSINRIIQPEDRIFAEYNSFLYHIERWAPIIELSLSITALVFSLMQFLK